MKPKNIAIFLYGMGFAFSIFGITIGYKLLNPEDASYILVVFSAMFLITFLSYWGVAFISWFCKNWNKEE